MTFMYQSIGRHVLYLLSGRCGEAFRCHCGFAPVFPVIDVSLPPLNLEDSQKRQIRESLQRARDTHNDSSNPFLVDTWILPLPLDPTREQFQWLTETATELKVPFAVKWKDCARLPQILHAGGRLPVRLCRTGIDWPDTHGMQEARGSSPLSSTL